jgi:hypothetical protein
MRVGASYFLAEIFNLFPGERRFAAAVAQRLNGYSLIQ